MTHHTSSKVLQGRYQIVQNLGAGVFEQTYVAIDIERPGQLKYVVREVNFSTFEPSYLETQRLNFLTEIETLKRLGQHERIPKLITHFEEDGRFYLIQEFIEGHALTAELPPYQHLGCLWSESEVIELLQDVLSILEFVHSQKVIHCNLKPDNLIRRARDGNLVLINFGCIQAMDTDPEEVLAIEQLAFTSLGYIPPEQFIGQTQPNSDIYALGMIAIQALTGLSPLELKIDPLSKEMIWRCEQIQVSDGLADILSQMTRHNYKDRFQSTTEVLQALRANINEKLPITNIQFPTPLYLQYSTAGKVSKRRDSSKSSPLVMGMKVGLAANSLIMGLGIYALINNSPARSETEILQQATRKYQAGNLEEAITLAKKIPSTSNVYPEAQASIEQWQNQWQTAAEKYLTAEKALHEGRWSEVLHLASQVPDNLYWQAKILKIVEQAKAKIEVQAQQLLTKAYEKAAVKDFDTALTYLHRIPQLSAQKTSVKQKIAEYSYKKQVRAIYCLQQAYNYAAAGNFAVAIAFLQQIPKNTAVYANAQTKLVEYAQKQRLQTEAQPVVGKIKQATTNELLQSSNSHSNLHQVDSQLQTRL